MDALFRSLGWPSALSGGVDPQDGEQVVIAPSGSFDLQPHTALAVLAFKRIESQSAQGGKILGRITLAGTALIFLEDNIEDPVEAVFDAPMPTGCLGKCMHVPCET